MTQEVEGLPYMDVGHVGLVHRDLVGARLKAFIRFPPLRGMYQRRHLQEVRHTSKIKRKWHKPFDQH